MKRLVCIHNVAEVDGRALPDFHVPPPTTDRATLLSALTSTEVGAVVLDIDDPDALNTVTQILEVRPQIGIVGITATNDLNHVIAAQRAGCKQITTRPIDLSDLVVAIRRAMNKTGEETRENQTFAVFSSIGGAGGTTLACHLAVELATVPDSKSVIIDLDFEFGGVARAFDVLPQFTIGDLAAAGAVDALLLEKAAVELPCRVDVISRPPNLRDAAGLDDNAIRSVIQTAQRQYPFVVLDLARKVDPIAGAAIEMCHKLLVVVQLTVPSIDNATRLLDALRSEGIMGDRIGIVINRFRKAVHTVSVEMAEERLGHKVFAIVPSDFANVNRALDSGQTIDSHSPVRSAIAELASKLVGPIDSPQSAKKSGGWFTSLSKKR